MATSQTIPTKNSTSLKKRRHKISGRTMAWFLKRLGSLLKEGFSLKEALAFLETLNIKEQSWIHKVSNGLEAGGQLDEELKKVGFPEQITARIYFAFVHGRFHQTILMCGQTLEEKDKRQKKLATLLMYPLLLICFIVSLLLSMRTMLLPHLQMDAKANEVGWEKFAQWSGWFIGYFPHLTIGMLGFALCSYSIFKVRSAHVQPKRQAERFAKIPFIGPFVQLYYSQLFSQEWGQLVESRLELQPIVQLMQKDSATDLMKEMGEFLEIELLKGKEFPDILSSCNFLRNDFSRIVRHGQTTSHLGKELLVYSNECLMELEEKIEKLMTFIQPLSFLFIGLLILSVYGALLLPMLSNMEGIL